MTTQGRACWSRRRFVAGGLLTIAAAPALARTVAGTAVESPPDLSTGDAAAGGAATNTGSGAVRSATGIDNRLTTPVYINGTGPYRFLIDTGAEQTLIAAEIATKLALPQGRKVMVQGIIRGQPSVLTRIESLRMGSLVTAPLQVPVLPRAMLTVDGYLGLDVLDRHRVIFDFAARTLTVARPKGLFSALWDGGNEAVVGTLGSSGRLRATNCLVDGIRAAAFVDSGAEVSVCNPALFAALQKRAANRERVIGPVGIYGVTGGSVVGTETNVDEILLGELRLTYTNLVVAGLEVFDVWGLSHQPAFLFGMDCLRRFARVTIDYGRMELRFDVARSQIVPPLQAALSPRLAG